MNGRARHHRWITLIATASVVLVGCSDEAPENKDSSTGTVTLRIGTDDDAARPSGVAIRAFADEVKARSDGRIVIEPVWQAAGEDVDNWDQAVARMVKDGQLDLGMIPSRAWDTEGVTTLRALNAPFLVTSDALADKIATTDLAGEMMAGLDKAGVTGLALIPEGLRHPFGFGRPLVALTDYAGKGFRMPHSAVGNATVSALGAKPQDQVGQAYTVAANSGQLAGADTSFALSASLPVQASVAGNITFGTKVNSLVINPGALAELPSEDQAVLRDSATATRNWVVDHRTTEAGDAKGFCDRQGTVVEATDAQLRALEQAVRPVYDQLQQDAQTKSMIDRIRTLKQTVLTPTEGVAVPCN